MGKQRRVGSDEARENERRAWGLRQRGWTQARIAADLGVEQQAVSKILHRVRNRALKELTREVAAVKADQTATLEYLLDEAVQAWERSRRPLVTVEETGGPEGATRRTVTVEQGGDPRFLTAARDALKEIRDVWGIGAPEPEPPRPSANVFTQINLLSAEYVAAIERSLAREAGGLLGGDGPQKPVGA